LAHLSYICLLATAGVRSCFWNGLLWQQSKWYAEIQIG
jgi:hypothetical protein